MKKVTVLRDNKKIESEANKPLPTNFKETKNDLNRSIIERKRIAAVKKRFQVIINRIRKSTSRQYLKSWAMTVDELMRQKKALMREGNRGAAWWEGYLEAYKAPMEAVARTAQLDYNQRQREKKMKIDRDGLFAKAVRLRKEKRKQAAKEDLERRRTGKKKPKAKKNKPLKEKRKRSRRQKKTVQERPKRKRR